MASSLKACCLVAAHNSVAIACRRRRNGFNAILPKFPAGLLRTSTTARPELPRLPAGARRFRS